MLIGERLRTLREEKNLSQGDIEKRTGMRAATPPEWRTATRFPRSTPSKNSRVP
jgi:transcriptional regulator with XRE-family HTH domain